MEIQKGQDIQSRTSMPTWAPTREASPTHTQNIHTSHPPSTNIVALTAQCKNRNSPRTRMIKIKRTKTPRIFFWIKSPARLTLKMRVWHPCKSWGLEIWQHLKAKILRYLHFGTADRGQKPQKDYTPSLSAIKTCFFVMSSKGTRTAAE